MDICKKLLNVHYPGDALNNWLYIYKYIIHTLNLVHINLLFIIFTLCMYLKLSIKMFMYN